MSVVIIFFCCQCLFLFFFFFSSRRRHTRFDCDWSSDVCSSDLAFTRSQLLPASSERKMPPSESGASTLAQRRDGLAGDTVTPRRPSGRRGRPSLAVMSLQLSPPSVLSHRPLFPPPAENPHGRRWVFHSAAYKIRGFRSEEHTSELQSQSNLVCRLLLEKKKNKYRPYDLCIHIRPHYELK